MNLAIRALSARVGTSMTRQGRTDWAMNLYLGHLELLACSGVWLFPELSFPLCCVAEDLPSNVSGGLSSSHSRADDAFASGQWLRHEGAPK